MELCKCDQGYEGQLNYVPYSIDKNSWNNHLFLASYTCLVFRPP